ncbi:tyrosine-type recombinase/integrase [Pontibacillus yanchengensis]|uniref:Tyrosine-type recombinase/integrase n=2 Tax=Pontibacillus yanchengensis TaxID=462910 RepID=A0A6I5A5C3_9BACI|nr:tyrosine-type recombinase/integrase [Pontibacillus yanchengensis]MYL35556.1 tyrosine-type recombinase/integrase [Pontibacillus yanchengensis]MYL54632.1 tyrosine-type recombinase/integrase [Pontibacillus yanchengensis]
MTFNQEVSKQGSAQVVIQHLLETHNMEDLQVAAINVLGISGDKDADAPKQEKSFQKLTVEESILFFKGSSKFLGLAETSKDTYNYEIKLFCDFISKKFGTLDIPLTEVIYPTSTLLEYINQNDISNNTSAKKSAFLRTFIKTVVQDFYLMNKEEFDGTLKVDWNKNGLPKFYKLEQLKELLILSKETAFGLRNYTIISAFLGSALRVSELVGIQLSDIDLEEEMITVSRKRNKNKPVPAYIQRDALNVLMKYIDFMYGHLAEDWKELKANYGGLYVFSTTGGETAMTDRAVRGMVKSLAKKAQSISDAEAENLSVHNFRHSYAIYGIRSGINLYAMMDLMGHSTVTSLKPYAKQSRDQIKEDMEKNPIAKLI